MTWRCFVCGVVTTEEDAICDDCLDAIEKKKAVIHPIFPLGKVKEVVFPIEER